MAPTMRVDTTVRLETLAIVQPGDTLVVAVAAGSAATAEAVNDFTERLGGSLPGVKIVVVAANALAVYRPGDAD